MTSRSFCPRLHHEPEQAWKGVLQHRCGWFNLYRFKALPEPETHWIRSTGNCVVSQRKKSLAIIKDVLFLFFNLSFLFVCLFCPLVNANHEEKPEVLLALTVVFINIFTSDYSGISWIEGGHAHKIQHRTSCTYTVVLMVHYQCSCMVCVSLQGCRKLSIHACRHCISPM